MSKRFFSFACAAAALIALQTTAFSPTLSAANAATKSKATSGKAPKTVAATYKGAIVMNADDGTVLFDDNNDIVSPPASVTKLMTFLIVKDAIAAGQITLETPVTVTAEDSKIGGTQVWLKEKEIFPVEELLYALMIQSANDAANALARAAAGSRAAFVERMNTRAKELGMTNTTFVSPHGLPPANRKIADSDLTSPHDLAVLARYLITKTDVLKYTSVRQRDFGAGQREKTVDMRNHNHLLGKVAGVDGLKTGFTNGAGFCLAATAERNGNRLIIVTMGSPDRISRDAKIAELFETYFAKLPAKPSSPISPISPISSATPAAAPAAKTPVSTPPATTPTTTTPAQAPSGDLPTISFPYSSNSSAPQKK